MHLNSFINSLDNALHDIDLEDDGIDVAFYWDTVHIRNALVGHAYYYDASVGLPDGGFQEHLFQTENALVYCLGLAGWFQPLRMLQPHQAEFFRLVNREFDIGSVLIPTGGIPQLLLNVKLQGLEEGDLENLSKLSKERIAELVKMQAGEAPKLFKVTQSVRYANWRGRLAAWVENGILELDRSAYHFAEIIESELFGKIQIALDRHRKDKIANNFADALALCQLHSKLQLYRNGKTKEIPRFLVTPLHMKVMAEDRIGENFSYSYKDREFNVFRDIDYFKLRANIIKPVNLGGADGKDRRTKLLREVRAQLSEFGLATKPLREILTRLAPRDQKVLQLIQDVQKYSFLEEVWLPFAAVTDVADALKSYVQAAIDLKQYLPFNTEVSEQVNDFMGKLKEVSQHHQEMNKLLTELQVAIQKRRSRTEGASVVDLSVISGLLRFGFPDEEEKQINNLLHRLLSEDGDVRTDAIREILLKVDPTQKTNLLDVAVAGAMWSLGMYETLSKLLSYLGDSHHYSLLILAGAARIKIKDITLARSLIDMLELKYATAVHDEDRAGIAIGLGYLYFHYRQTMSSVGQARLNERESRELIEKAIGHARIGMELERNDMRKKVYAINQSLYYLTADGDKQDADEIKGVATDLMKFDEDSQLWQYRYDDTLASYFEWSAQQDPTERKHWLERAWARIKIALNNCNQEDEEVRKHSERIMMARQLRK